MLDLYRFNNSDLEDVKLADPALYAIVDEGHFLHPFNTAEDTWGVFAGANPEAAASSNLCCLVFMEKNRTDARAIGKMTIVRGASVRGKTDVFFASDATTMAPGLPLTVKKDADGVVKFALAGATDVVKGFVYMSPTKDAQGLLHFELVR